MIKIILIFLFFIVSCTQYEQQPELKDPTFNEIQAKIGELDKASTSKVEECKKLYNQAEASKPQTGLKSKVLTQWKDCNQKKSILEQDLKYHQILLETRRIAVAKEYSDSIKSGKPWPPAGKSNVPQGTNH